MIVFRKMDPYAVIEYNGTKYKTRTHHGAGKTPVWNHVGYNIRTSTNFENIH
jgi:Ca2+-dependent lipid-binding protein